MTGTEAISNGVSIFREPQARNARTTLLLMSTILGTMFLGVSALAALTHSVPFVSGTPTVVSEIGKLVYGSSTVGHVLFYMLQTATALILILAANTSFTGFPFLVSFVAEDSFLPRKLTVRGHRLVFSNGVLLLAGASIALLIATDARVSALIPMYAIGVFTGFTMAGAGMVKHHLRIRDPHWRTRVGVNGFAAVVCAVVVVVFAVAEFTQGAWVVVVVMPLLIYALVRTNRQYRAEDIVLEEGAAVQACEARILQRHVVVILIDRIDLAAARAIQYARTLMPDDLRAVHFNIDDRRAENLMERWQRIGLSQLPLDVIDCPDRRLGRAALELAAELADGETEVSMLLPRRSYGKALKRILHDQTADYIVDFVSQLSHVNATIVPFMVAPGIERHEAVVAALAPKGVRAQRAQRPVPPDRSSIPLPTIDGVTPIAALQWRRQARIAGPRQDPARPTLVRRPDAGVRAGRQQWRVDRAGLPRPSIHPRHPGRDPDGGRGGRGEAPRQVGHDQPSLRDSVDHVAAGSHVTRPAGGSPKRNARRLMEYPLVTWLVPILAPLGAAALLVPSRGHLDSADDALDPRPRHGGRRVTRPPGRRGSLRLDLGSLLRLTSSRCPISRFASAVIAT